MERRYRVTVLPSLRVRLVRNLLQVCFPYHFTPLAEYLQPPFQRGVENGIVRINPCPRLVERRDRQGCVLGLGRSSWEDGEGGGGLDAEFCLEEGEKVLGRFEVLW